MKIGYQGIEYSNSFFVAQEFVEDNNIKDYELIALTNSYNVYEALIKNNIDYGVMATYSTVGKEVAETMEVLKHNKLSLVKKYDKVINHCLFKKNKDVKIVGVASHIQALKQSEKIREEKHLNFEEMVVDDTALAAKQLKEGILDDRFGVMCTKEAGINNGLYLVLEKFQDDKDSTTTFGIFKKAD